MSDLQAPWLLLDVGTTSLRAYVTVAGQVQATISAPEGVALTTREGRGAFCNAVRKRCEEVLAQAGVSWQDLGSAAACGMITSGLGLLEIPHIPTPAGLAELALAMQASDALPIPLWLCPGVRNDAVADYDLRSYDFMRGEEAQALGLDRQNGLFVSTGSHMKFVWLADGRIERCRTTMGGEMLAALTSHTILADSCGFVRTLCPKWVLWGMQASLDRGITAAAFDVRKLDVLAKGDAEERANYLAGAVMAQDILAVRGDGVGEAIVTGGMMAEVFRLVWEAMGCERAAILPQGEAEQLAVTGLWRVVAYRAQHIGL